MINEEAVRQVVKEVLSEVIKNQALARPQAQASAKENLSPAQKNLAKWLGRNVEQLQIEVTKKVVEAIAANPARLNVSRAGTRYLTRVALKFLADHAVAKDAVYAELPEGFAEKNGWIFLKTKAKDKEEYLLRPDLGRQLCDESLQIVNTQGTKNCDIQITVADGLSPWAAERYAKPLVEELTKLFTQSGLNVGKVFCVKYARIAIQDVIGQALGAKVSMILLGERPGLGGGDSLSNYMIYGPKVGAVNALKSMISNIHPQGHTPQEAAKLTVYMVKKMFEQNCSGINLKI